MKKLISVILMLVMLCAVALAEESVPDRADISVGDVITFGIYEQDNDLNNGSEPIEWIVLDVQDGKALLLSKYGLDVKPYNTENLDITRWENCTMRTWLNNDFLNDTFSETERQAILLTDVDNSDAQGYGGWNTIGGNNTQDYVFLLSYADANKYLEVQHYSVEGAAQNMISRVAPTAYAIANGANAWDDMTVDGEAAGWWWLRSPGEYQYCAAIVIFDGSLLYDFVDSSLSVVRPAFWMNLESDIF